jgi:hypothetical protein
MWRAGVRTCLTLPRLGVHHQNWSSEVRFGGDKDDFLDVGRRTNEQLRLNKRGTIQRC